jgi:hypothetical protein
MDTQQHIRLLQITYAAQLADAVRQYGQAGILERVTEEKRAERRHSAGAQVARLGVTAPEAAFTTSAELFGCADWAVTESGVAGDFEASAGRCLLCAMVKKAGGPSPCRIFCLDPIEAMVQGLRPEARIEVLETLYDGKRCRVRVTGDGTARQAPSKVPGS